jgi:hypothetical protein
MKNLMQKIFTDSALYAIILSLLFAASSCSKPEVGIDIEVEAGKQTLAALDKAINTLKTESSNWQQVLQETRDELVDSVNSSIKNEVTNLISNSIAATGAQVRCEVDFVRTRARQELIHIRNKLAQKIKQPLLNESPLFPVFCSATPTSVDLNLAPERRDEIKFGGYDFSKETVKVLLLNGEQEIDISGNLAQPTQYLLSLNLSGIKFTSKINKINIRSTDTNEMIGDINVKRPPTPPGNYYFRISATGYFKSNNEVCSFASLGHEQIYQRVVPGTEITVPDMTIYDYSGTCDLPKSIFSDANKTGFYSFGDGRICGFSNPAMKKVYQEKFNPTDAGKISSAVVPPFQWAGNCQTPS